MVTLDDVERTFSSDMALVCDAEGPSGIGGTMGGQISEVSETTTRVLMEAATWVGPNIMRTSKALGLRTEASARFEKQLHPEQAMAAERLAARLMVELCGARFVPGTIDVYPEPAEARTITLRSARMDRLLGERIDEETTRGILERLGFELLPDTGWVTPVWRYADVRREADLIEEVARIHGLDKLPTTLPARGEAIGRLTGSQPLRRRLEDLLRDRGLFETISYTFTSPDALARLRLSDAETLAVENPLSEDLSVMRPLLLPGLLDAARHNAAHGRAGVALFESAHVYLPAGPLEPAPEGSPGGKTPANESKHLAALLTEGAPGGWRTPGRPADFFAAKTLLEALLEAAGVDWRAEPAGAQAAGGAAAPAAGGDAPAVPFLHPGRAASVVTADGVYLGWLGEVHPLVLREWELQGPVAAFDIDVDLVHELGQGRVSTYSDVTSFPAVLQDIAVIVPDDVPAARLAEVVRAGAGDLLSSLGVFDLYRGEQVGEGKKSLALRLEFRAPDRTLTDEEVAERRAAIEKELGSIGGRLRAGGPGV
jgi:phenylalanyl-tRNA synthetase beta chain